MKSILGVVGTGLVALSIILTTSADNARAGDVSLTHDCINPHGLTADVDGDEGCGPSERRPQRRTIIWLTTAGLLVSTLFVYTLILPVDALPQTTSWVNSGSEDESGWPDGSFGQMLDWLATTQWHLENRHPAEIREENHPASLIKMEVGTAHDERRISGSTSPGRVAGHWLPGWDRASRDQHGRPPRRGGRHALDASD